MAGVFITANQAYDDAALRLPIGLAQSLLRVERRAQWLVLLEETESTDDYLAQFRARFPESAQTCSLFPGTSVPISTTRPWRSFPNR